MNTRIVLKAIVCAGLLINFSRPVASNAQSPWVRSKAGFYAQAAWHFIPTYDAKFEALNAITPLQDRKLRENTFQFYGEYGITAKTTAIVSVPLRYLQSGDLLTNYTKPQTLEGYLFGLGNTTVAIRHQILQRKLPLTATLRVDLPVAQFNQGAGLRPGYQAWTFMPMLSTGIGSGNSYAFGYAGYGYRTNGYSHVINLGAEGGLKFGNFWLIGFTEWLQSLKNGSVQLPRTNLLTGLYVNDQSYWSVGFKGIYAFNRFTGVVFSAAGAFYAELVPRKPGLGLGVYFKWD